MIEIVVWTAMLVGVQALMYWQAAGKIEELEHLVKHQEINYIVRLNQQEDQIISMRLQIESIALQLEYMRRDSQQPDTRRSEYLKSIPGDGDSKYIIK